MDSGPEEGGGGVPPRSLCTDTVWKNGIWTRAETAGGKEVEGVKKSWRGNNEDRVCMAGWGLGQEEEREKGRLADTGWNWLDAKK